MLKIPKTYKKVLYVSCFFLNANYAKAQEVQKINEREIYFEPRISFEQRFTNNINLDNSGVGGNFSEISPGFRWFGNTARIKGYADYSLIALFDSQKKQNGKIKNIFNGFATVEAIENIGYIDIYGSIANQPVSAFGPFANDNRFLENSSQTKNYRISPYLRGDFGDSINYQVKYDFSEANSDSKDFSKNTTKNAIFSLEKNPIENLVGWSVSANHQIQEIAKRRITESVLKGAVRYAPNAQLVVSAIAGAEITDQISPVRESHSIVGVEGKWRPSERTLISANIEKHYYGDAHEILIQHQTARTVWRYRDSKGISNGFGSFSAVTGTVSDLLNVFYSQIEPDPVRRAQMVIREAERLGLATDTQIFQDYLRSTSTLQRDQRLSLAILGIRSTITFELFQTKNSRLVGSLASGDDFDLNNEIIQAGWNLVGAHRLTPLSSLFLNINEQKNKGSNMGVKNKNRFIRLGFNTRLSKSADATFQMQRTLFDGNVRAYGESSITGTLNYRF